MGNLIYALANLPNLIIMENHVNKTGFTGVHSVCDGVGITGQSGPSGGSLFDNVFQRLFWRVEYFFKFKKRWQDDVVDKMVYAMCSECDDSSLRFREFEGWSDVDKGESFSEYVVSCDNCGAKLKIEISVKSIR